MMLCRLEGRKYLEDHELNLMIDLLKDYCSATAQSLPEQTVSKEIQDMLISNFLHEFAGQKRADTGPGESTWTTSCYWFLQMQEQLSLRS